MSGTLASVTGGNSGGTTQSMGPTSADTAAFNAKAGNSASSLTVNGNSIDTGRYVISASNTYSRPTDGGQAGDGMVLVYDKETRSSAEAYGDPHLFTSAGDRANFMSHGVLLNLGDGTRIEITPTKESDGVAYIDKVTVSKDNQLITQSGLYGGTTTTSGVTQGSLSYDTNDTVLSVGRDGSLGTLYTASGTALDSKTAEKSLDTPSGTPPAPGGGAPGTQASPQASAATEKEIHLLQQLISTLQDQISATGNNVDTKSLISQLEQLVSSLLSGSGGDKATTINTLLPKLETTLGQLGQSGQGSSAEASLINQVISALMGQSDGTASSSGTERTPSTGSNAGASFDSNPSSVVPASYNPSHGISGSEIDQMLARSRGMGEEVDYSAVDRAVDNFAAHDAVQNSNGSSNSSPQPGATLA